MEALLCAMFIYYSCARLGPWFLSLFRYSDLQNKGKRYTTDEPKDEVDDQTKTRTAANCLCMAESVLGCPVFDLTAAVHWYGCMQESLFGRPSSTCSPMTFGKRRCQVAFASKTIVRCIASTVESPEYTRAYQIIPDHTRAKHILETSKQTDKSSKAPPVPMIALD
jgi:hypothetical protein